MVRGIVIPAAAEVPLREIEVTPNGSAVADTVGGFMEAVDLPRLGVTVYVNEEGLIRQLPFNSRASFLWWHHVPAVRRRAMLVGDAVIVGLPDADGVDTEVPAATRELLLTPVRYRVELQVGGDPMWRTDGLRYPDYWEALMWATLLLEQIPNASDSRVVPAEPHERAATTA